MYSADVKRQKEEKMISTRGRYAIRIMIDLAENNSEKYIPLKEIAERQEISKKYLEILVKDMVEEGLILGHSGKGGGYKLCRKPEEYTVGEILDLMEKSMSPVACLANKKYTCDRKDKCRTLPMWTKFDSMVHDYFYGIKLTDLLE